MGIAEKGTPRKRAPPGRRFWNGEDGSLSRGTAVQGGGEQDHARSQEPGLDQAHAPGQGKGRVQCPQGQGVLGEEPAVPQGEQLGKGEDRQEQEGEGHPQVERARGAGGPAASRCPGRTPEGAPGSPGQAGPGSPSPSSRTGGHRAGRPGPAPPGRAEPPPPGRQRSGPGRTARGRAGVAAVSTAARRSRA